MWAVFFWLLLWNIGWISPSLAAEYFSEAAGSDSNNCTTGAKCQSFTRLMERTMSPGDTNHLKCGEVYRETAGAITPPTSGTSTTPITLRSYGPCYQHKGTHTGANNAANLVAAGTNFSIIGVAAGHRVFNLTKGAHCYVSSLLTTSTTNDTLVCSMGLAHTLDVDWDTGDRYVVENKPVVTLAALFNSGWTNEGSNVWSHPFPAHPGRHIWINGKSTLPMLHDGTCSLAGMDTEATDTQFCAVCNTGTARDCGPGKVYIKSTSNPATRWTNPGVEVASSPATTLVQLSTRNWWTIRDIAIEKIYGSPMTMAGSNVLIDNVRLGWSQLKNCSTGCVGGSSYPWMAGQDDRGAQLLGMGTSTPTSGIVVRNFLGHDCENNCITMSGFSSIAATFQDCEIFNNAHSTFNTGLSSSSAGSRTITIERCALHAGSTVWHSGGGGATHTAIFRNNFIYDIPALNDPRQLTPSGRADPFGIYLEDPGTYAHSNNIVIEGGHGWRIKEGAHTFTNNVIVGNSENGINAANPARIRLNNNIIADNGTGTVSSSNFQVGCSATPCSLAIFDNNQSDTNKFRQPSGTAFGYLSGIDSSMTLADWQAMSHGDGNSVTSASCFVNAPAQDFNLSNGCDDIATRRGVFREISLSTAAIQGSTLTSVWSVGGVQPLSACTSSLATVTYDGAGQTEGACATNLPIANEATLAMGAAPAAGATVQLSGGYGFVEDSQRIGGFLNARSRAFGPASVTNAGGASSMGWIAGTTRIMPSGSNRVLLVGACWEKNAPTAPPIAVTGCTYGGQPLTKIAEVKSTDPPSEVLGSLWLLHEVGIAAAGGTTLTCTPDETPEGGRPVVLVSGVYADVNQITPLASTVQTATATTGTSLSTSALSATANPGVAVQLGCAGVEGTWSAGSGWLEQMDICEDTSCGTRLHIADRATTGDTPAGSVTFATAQPTLSERLGLLTVALNGSAALPPNPGGIVVRTQTASRCAFHNAPGWQGAQDTPCTIVPTHQLAVVGEYRVTDADEPTPIGKQLMCCFANCTVPENFFAVDDTGANGVRYAPSGLFPHGLAIPDRLLTGPACTHVPGAYITQDSMIPQALDVGQCSTMAYIVEVLGTVNPVTQPVLTCKMALDDGTPFAAGATTTINVVPGAAVGH